MPRALLAAMTMLAILLPASLAAQQPTWPVHSLERPRPPVVDPGPPPLSAPPPSDAMVLFDGRSLLEWTDGYGAPARWTLRAGAMEVAPGGGAIRTRRGFGDVQLHIEWATPIPARGAGQERGNSGVFLMGFYEVQVLDSYRNATYADGQAGALYGQAPPLVNASRPPGRWQSYDIIFRRPRFAPDGTLQSPARMTVLHNGILVQDDVELMGRTVHAAVAHYEAHEPRLPILLQDHGDRVRYRNIWVRSLE